MLVFLIFSPDNYIPVIAKGATGKKKKRVRRRPCEDGILGIDDLAEEDLLGDVFGEADEHKSV